MPKSLFDPVQTITDGTLLVSGPFDTLLDEDSELAAQYLVWLIMQNGRGVTGSILPWGSRWEDSADPPDEWVDGPASATGAVVALGPDGVQTFTWNREVTLQHR